MNVTLSEVVYRAIFPPEGAIPLKAKRNIQAIDARIKEIKELAEGKAVEGMTRRISSLSESKRLTEQIVQLRDSCSPPMSYREIMRQLGYCITPDAARNRYDDYKKRMLRQEGYSALTGDDHIVEADEMVKPEPAEKAEPIRATSTPPEGRDQPDQSPTIQEPQTVDGEGTIQESSKAEKPEKDNKAHDLTPSEAGKILGPRIPHTEDDWILQEKTNGKTFTQIRSYLQARGISCTMNDVMSRYYAVKRKHDRDAAGKKSPQTPTTRELGQQHKQDRRAGPEPKSFGRAELDQKIWTAWKAGKTPDQISDELCAEGLYFGKGSVTARLRAQGADL